jgi:anti-sigma factor RsiW
MSEIACASGVELLMDYLEGVLSADVRAALDQHVAGCPRCTAFVASYLDTPRILREATGTTLPADVEASLKAFLRARTTAFRSA